VREGSLDEHSIERLHDQTCVDLFEAIRTAKMLRYGETGIGATSITK